MKLPSRPKNSHPRVIPNYNYASKYPQNKAEKNPSKHARQITRAGKSKHADPSKLLSQKRRGKATETEQTVEKVCPTHLGSTHNAQY